MKSKRQEQILALIQDHDIETQEQLLDELKKSGFQATQATISRDIKQLRIIKELGPNGTYRYVSLTEAGGTCVLGKAEHDLPAVRDEH